MEQEKKLISLKKGEKIDLKKEFGGLTRVLIGLGWDVKKFDNGADFDLDASAFVLGANGKVRTEKDFIFYGNLDSADETPNANAQHDGQGFVHHTGDNRTGDGTGDDEVITVDFSRIPQDVEKIAITVTIYQAKTRKQTFGQVSNAFVRLAKMKDKDDFKGEDLLRFDLDEDFSTETALVVCELYRHDNSWKFSAVGSGFNGGLAALASHYGLSVTAEE